MPCLRPLMWYPCHTPPVLFCSWALVASMAFLFLCRIVPSFRDMPRRRYFLYNLASGVLVNPEIGEMRVGVLFRPSRY